MRAETSVKSVRAPVALWAAVEAKAASAGLTVNAFISGCLSEACGVETPPPGPAKPARVAGPKVAKVKRAKRALQDATAKAAHLGLEGGHKIQVGPVARPAGSLLKKRPAWTR